MIYAIAFPEISPNLISVTLFGVTLAIRWYALAYIVGIIIGWRMGAQILRRARLWPKGEAPATTAQLDDLITWIIVGIIAGGRLGFVLFYEPAYYLANPLDIPKIWQGGMSFHGGFLGVVVAGLWFCRSQKIPMLPMADVLAYGTPPALALGRIANFINAELWGRPTDVPWGVIFPGAAAQDCPGVVGLCARHPSQLYEAALEGVLLTAVLVWLVWRRRALFRPGMVTGVFLAGYGIARFIVEIYRQADAQFITPDNPMGHVIGTASIGITMGQVLSLPMIIVGLWMIAYATRRPA